MRTAAIYSDFDSELGRQCEFQCQLMLKAGIEFLAEHPGFNLDEPAEINAAMKDVRIADAKQRGQDPMPGISGGQYDTVMNHLRVIQQKSYGTWFEELSRSREAKEVFEFDGTFESIPNPVKQ